MAGCSGGLSLALLRPALCHIGVVSCFVAQVLCYIVQSQFSCSLLGRTWSCG